MLATLNPQFAIMQEQALLLQGLVFFLLAQ